jgi:hypothetical protein
LAARWWTPAVFDGGKVADEVRRATVILVASSVAANSSRNDGYERMKLSNSGGTLASNYW